VVHTFVLISLEESFEVIKARKLIFFHGIGLLLLDLVHFFSVVTFHAFDHILHGIFTDLLGVHFHALFVLLLSKLLGIHGLGSNLRASGLHWLLSGPNRQRVLCKFDVSVEMIQRLIIASILTLLD
jgi:hypothetical protein